MRAQLFGLLAGSALLAGAGLVGCGEAESFSRFVAQTSTVAVGNASVIRIVAPVLVDVAALRTGSDLNLTLKATLTASTASRAEALSDLVRVEVTTPSDGVRLVSIVGLGAEDRVTGTLEIAMPKALDVAIEAGPGGRVRAMEGDVQVVSNAGAEVYDATGSIVVTTGGGALIDSLMLQSTSVRVQASGPIELRLPPVPSVSLSAASGASAAVVVTHPALPAVLGQKTQYQAVVNGGLATATLQSVSGNVSIRSR